MKNYCYINGKILPTEKAAVSVNDLGVIRGFGAFDYLRTYRGVPFLFDEHMTRFKRTAKILKMRIPIKRNEMRKIIEMLIRKNKIDDAGIRTVLTGGVSANGVDYDLRTPTLFITVKELPKYPKTVYERGVSLMTFEYMREFPEAKSTNYLRMLTLSSEKKKRNAFEILYKFNGRIYEGTTFNFFGIKNKTLITPKQNILMGTRRNFVITLAKKYGYTVLERPLAVSALPQLSESFITSTTRDILPVVKIDARAIGNGKVGIHTKVLMDVYKTRVREMIQ
jgi:branched-subunit amino acid aminotransferase/4-amino-4-deoxychorismate lyase